MGMSEKKDDWGKSKRNTCCCLATCSLSLVACFLMASIEGDGVGGEEKRAVACLDGEIPGKVGRR